MNKIKQFLAGIFIGIGVILPGVSGSVIAIMMGVYDNIIYLLNDKNLNIINKIKKLLPILIGLFLGIMTFGNILLLLYTKFPFEIMYIFIGLILGETPILIKEIKNNTNNNLNLKYFFLTLTLSILLIVIPNTLNFTQKNYNVFNPLYLFLAGFLYISGKIIPGISSSLFLMILGLYNYILNIFANPFSLSINEFILLIPFFLGVIIGFLILIKLINYLLSKHFINTYSAIIGFVVGSVFAIYPGFELSLRGIISLFFMILSFILINKMSNINIKE